MQLGRFSCTPGTAVQPHFVTYSKTSRFGQLVVAYLHPVTGHFQVLAGDDGCRVAFDKVG